MDILEELKYYCKTDNPVGALMLSGEWGCGKTYLIKNKLTPELEKEENICAVLCISLFGLDSIDAIKQEVKKLWLEKAGEIIPKNGGRILSKAADAYQKLFETVKEILPEKAQNGGETISSILDWVNYVPVTNTICERKVILVFDDLERSNISCADILGCINDYCENQHFNVIIVANEEKIRKTASVEENSNEAENSGSCCSDTALSYDEIKEKIVQRVIPFTPDYAEIVDNSIDSAEGIVYRGLLRNNKEMLVRILAGDIDDKAVLEKFKKDNYKRFENKAEYDKEEDGLRELLKQRPHNIRSFKCAIQDFKRVYDVLEQVGIAECDNWLISFTCYMMTYKAGLISDVTDYGIYLSNDTVRNLYPDIFHSNYMVNGIACWIIKGDWNRTCIEEELRYVLKRDEAKSPADILRTHCLTDIEDEIIEEGFDALLELAYSGKLTLDEYVGFIENSYYARTYEVDIPDIDWQKVKEGIDLQFKQMLLPDYEDPRFYRVIFIENKDLFKEDEWSAYQLISDFREQERLAYEKNRVLYIELLSSSPSQAFELLGNKKYDMFTTEMETATFEAYKNVQNMDKKNFADGFSRIWIGFRKKEGMGVQRTEKLLEKLREDLINLRDDYREKKKQISAGHTQYFIEEIDKILRTEEGEPEQ